jgi:hypothetical protein
MGSGDVAPPFLNMALHRRDLYSHFLRGWMDHGVSLGVMEKNLLPLPEIKPRPIDRPAHSLVYILNELSRLPYRLMYCNEVHPIYE